MEKDNISEMYKHTLSHNSKAMKPMSKTKSIDRESLSQSPRKESQSPHQTRTSFGDDKLKEKVVKHEKAEIKEHKEDAKKDREMMKEASDKKYKK